MCFAFSTLLLQVDAIMVMKNVDGTLNVTFNDPKLLLFNIQDITHVHVTYCIPSVLTEVCFLCKLAVLAHHFGDATALGQPSVGIALLGNISFGP
jgi:hypothetical protein